MYVLQSQHNLYIQSPINTYMSQHGSGRYTPPSYGAAVTPAQSHLTSMPLPATSVATRMSLLPSLRLAKAVSRCSWLRPPWRVAVLNCTHTHKGGEGGGGGISMRDIFPACTIEMVYPLNSHVRIPFSCATIAQHINHNNC